MTVALLSVADVAARLGVSERKTRELARTHHCGRRLGRRIVFLESDYLKLVDALPSGGPQRAIPGVRVDWTRGDESEANARFIAAARTAVPDLLALVEALRRERDEARASEARLIEAMIMELASERPSEKIMREALQQCGCTPAAAGIAGAAWRKLAALAASERGS